MTLPRVLTYAAATAAALWLGHVVLARADADVCRAGNAMGGEEDG